jgi:hypothetical protein
VLAHQVGVAGTVASRRQVTSWQQYSSPGAAFGSVFSGPVFWGAMLALAAALRLRRQAVL